MQYQLTPIETGKWYISARPEITRTDGTGEREAQPGRDDSRVAGPFDSDEQAEAKMQELLKNDPNLKGRLYVWPS
jgi:hypothetical protein